MSNRKLSIRDREESLLGRWQSCAPGEPLSIGWLSFSALSGALGSTYFYASDLPFLAALFLTACLLVSIILAALLLGSGRTSLSLMAIAFVLTALFAVIRQADLRQEELDFLLGRPVSVQGHLVKLAGRAVLAQARFVDYPFSQIAAKIELPVSHDKESFVDREDFVTLSGIWQRVHFQSEARLCQSNSSGIYWRLAGARALDWPGDGQDKLQKDNLFAPFFSRFNLFLEKLRRDMADVHGEALGKINGGLLASMVLGDRAIAVDHDLKLSFKKAGLAHLLAASGMNLTIILAGVYFFCRQFGQRDQRSTSKTLENFVSVVSVVCFSLLAGPSPSVMRAMVMCLLVLICRFLFYRVTAHGALSMALLLSIMLDPFSVFDIGLELSYAATFGVLTFVPYLDELFAFPLLARWLPAIVRKLIAVVLSAQIAVLPLQLFYFAQFSTVFLIANAIAEPLVAPITIIGFISSLLVCPVSLCPISLVPAIAPLLNLCRLLDVLAWPLVQLLVYLVRWLSTMPLSTLVVAKPPLSILVTLYLLYLAIAALTQRRVLHQSFSAFLLLFFSFLLLFFSQMFAPSLEFLGSGAGFVLRRAGQMAWVSGQGDYPVQRYLENISEPVTKLPFAQEQKILLPADKLCVFAKPGVERGWRLEFYEQENKENQEAGLSIERGTVRGAITLARWFPYLPLDLPLRPTLRVHSSRVGPATRVSIGL